MIAPPPLIDATWDAGDLGCGEILILLRARMAALPSGGLLQLTARDPAAPVDLPAWSRMTGHAIRSSAPPVFLIQRRHDS